jgi:hypothetical protein
MATPLQTALDLLLTESKKDDPCWDGYRQLGTKKRRGKTIPNCIPESTEDDLLEEAAEYQGKKVTLNKPFRTPDGPKKFAVYVKNDSGNVVIVRFGDPELSIKRDDPERKKAFRARHKCDQQTDKTSAAYWSCRMWSSKNVGDIA